MIRKNFGVNKIYLQNKVDKTNAQINAAIVLYTLLDVNCSTSRRIAKSEQRETKTISWQQLNSSISVRSFQILPENVQCIRNRINHFDLCLSSENVDMC